MGYRAYRDNRTPEVEDDVTYRIPGVREEFMARQDELCPDCSTPVITMRDKASGKVTRRWHDDSCPIAPEEARLKLRVLNRHK